MRETDDHREDDQQSREQAPAQPRGTAGLGRMLANPRRVRRS